MLFPKLRTYAKFKITFNREPYLILLNNSKEITTLARLRMSSHKLEIEKGRHTRPKTELNLRTCQRCCRPVIDDEMHFLVSCDVFNSKREELFIKINNLFPDFINTADDDKLKILLSSEDSRFIKPVAKYVNMCFNELK